MTNTCFLVAVWGAEYIRLFLDFTLPSLLSKNNIPGLQHKDKFEFLISTSESNVELLDSSPVIEHLREHLPVHINAVSRFFFMGGAPIDRYARMSALHRGMIEYCENLDAGMIFIPSDTVWSDGSVRNLERLISKDHRVIIAASLRSRKDTLLTALDNRHGGRNNEQQVLQISSRDLVALALEFPHEITQSRFIDSFKFTDEPANIYWHLDDVGLLVRGFHVHPVYVRPRYYATNFKHTFDSDFLELAVPEVEEYYICDNSDSIFFIDITDAKESTAIPIGQNISHEIPVAHWALENTNKPHRHIFTKSIWLHTGIEVDDWLFVDRGADLFAQKVLGVYDILDKEKNGNELHSDSE
jgi:hypothetical protein